MRVYIRRSLLIPMILVHCSTAPPYFSTKPPAPASGTVALEPAPDSDFPARAPRVRMGTLSSLSTCLSSLPKSFFLFFAGHE